MDPTFHVEVAREEDLPEIASFLIPSFSTVPVEALMGNVDTPEGRKGCAARHLQAWKEHADETGGRPCAVKCVHTDPTTGKQTIAAFVEWFIFDQPRSEENVQRLNYLLSCSWIADDGQREMAQGMLQPVSAIRAKWLRGRPHGVVMYLATAPAWRRKGAATMCLQWGIEQCGKLGVPAFLEATEAGFPLYRRLGFEAVDEIGFEMDGQWHSFPVMMWWPPGTKNDEKKVLG